MEVTFVLASPPRRQRQSHEVVVRSRTMEHERFVLKHHAVLITATDSYNAANPMLVGYAVEALLRIGPHLLRVTRHHPEEFLVHFNVPADRDALLRHKAISIDGVLFRAKPWCPDEHAVRQKWLLHVCIVIKRLPLDMWTLEGARGVLGKFCIIDRLDSHTAERRDTRTFACWAWVWSLTDIPTQHCLSSFAEGASQVTEMQGYSPPLHANRAMPEPPEWERSSLLFHLDHVEDWSPREQRSPGYGVSGLPSSGSDNDDRRPLPDVSTPDWTFNVEDSRPF
ncbi:hypothetical protein VPH35_058193 [Triticum aestivum]